MFFRVVLLSLPLGLLGQEKKKVNIDIRPILQASIQFSWYILILNIVLLDMRLGLRKRKAIAGTGWVP